jgi:hypothetical protein
MIYFAHFRNKLPQRLAEDHAHDFYQMWFGNERGQEYFEEGTTKNCPDYPQLSIWGEDMPEAGVFKKILNGEVAEGIFDIDDEI